MEYAVEEPPHRPRWRAPLAEANIHRRSGAACESAPFLEGDPRPDAFKAPRGWRSPIRQARLDASACAGQTPRSRCPAAVTRPPTRLTKSRPRNRAGGRRWPVSVVADAAREQPELVEPLGTIVSATTTSSPHNEPAGPAGLGLRCRLGGGARLRARDSPAAPLPGRADRTRRGARGRSLGAVLDATRVRDAHTVVESS